MQVLASLHKLFQSACFSDSGHTFQVEQRILVNATPLEAIATRLAAIATRLEALAIKLGMDFKTLQLFTTTAHDK